MAKKDKYIYIHTIPNTDIVFYVGKGTNCRYKRKTSRNNWWKNIVNKHGFESVIIEDGLEEKEAYELEIYYISQFKEWGFKLCNLSSGGENGRSGTKMNMEIYNNKIRSKTLGRKQSDEERKRRSVSRINSLKNNPNIMKNLSKKHKESKYRCKKINQFDLNGVLLNEFFSIDEASKVLGISRTGINNNLKNLSKKSGGFIFKYCN